MSEWQPIETAPKGRRQKSVLLACAGTNIPIYCGRHRAGTIGEPQQLLIEWRCDSSGRFATPTHWMPLPEPPKTATREPHNAEVSRAALGA